jgi:hypothetical protein
VTIQVTLSRMPWWNASVSMVAGTCSHPGPELQYFMILSLRGQRIGLDDKRDACVTR